MIREFRQSFWEKFKEYLFASTPKNFKPYTSAVKHVINDPKVAEKVFRKLWNKDLIGKQEEVYVIYVNEQNEVVEWEHLHKGGTNKCFIDIPLLFEFAFEYKKRGATGFFLAHNHTKGSLKPSPSDLIQTQEIKATAEKLEFAFLDHIIITEKGSMAFSEKVWL